MVKNLKTLWLNNNSRPDKTQIRKWPYNPLLKEQTHNCKLMNQTNTEANKSQSPNPWIPLDSPVTHITRPENGPVPRTIGSDAAEEEAGDMGPVECNPPKEEIPTNSLEQPLLSITSTLLQAIFFSHQSLLIKSLTLELLNTLLRFKEETWNSLMF